MTLAASAGESLITAISFFFGTISFQTISSVSYGTFINIPSSSTFVLAELDSEFDSGDLAEFTLVLALKVQPAAPKIHVSDVRIMAVLTEFIH